MDILHLTEDDARWLLQYEKAVLQWRVAKTSDEAKLAALLMWVIDFGNVSQLEKVLAAGANLNVVYPRGTTPLGQAFTRFRNEGAEAVRLMLEAGADPRVPSERETPLALACKRGPSELVSLVLAAFLKAGKTSPADFNVPLLHTAARGDVSSMKQLLGCGAAINQRGLYQIAAFPTTPMSALMVAAVCCCAQAVKVLLEAGADVNLKDDEGHTALDYALADPETARKIAPLLQQAGALSGKPFPPVVDEATRGFSTAARKPAFKKAVARIRELTGIKPGPLEGPEDRIPGGYGFLVDENSGKTLVEGGVAEYLGIRDRARHFVEQHHSEILALGAYLFHTRDLMKQNGAALALLPTTDVYRVVAAVETECPDSCDALIAWLRNLEKDQPFLITGVGRDFIEGKFITPIQEPAALVKRIDEICPSDNTTPNAEQKAIALLRETNRLFLWWD